MRITYVSQARFPTEKAHGHQIAQVVGAMARLGHSLTVLAPDVRNTVLKEARSYYGLQEDFRAEKLPTFDALQAWWVPGFLSFALTMRSYGKALAKWLREESNDLLYTRSPRLLPVLVSSGIPVILELHTLPLRSRGFLRACGRCRLIVCLTAPMRDALCSWGVAREKVIVEGDGVDLQRFVLLPSRAEARGEWRLPEDKRIAVYVGSLVTRGTIEKGVSELLQALALLRGRGESVFGWIIGGPRDRVPQYLREARSLGLLEEDVRFEGPVHNSRVPSALSGSDVCVYPAPASSHAFFQRDTSPLKVFEYLASGRPTVCADIPPLRGVVDPSLVHFCVPGDISSLAEAILSALQSPRSDEKKRLTLLHHVSWDSRMKRILAQADLPK